MRNHLVCPTTPRSNKRNERGLTTRASPTRCAGFHCCQDLPDSNDDLKTIALFLWRQTNLLHKRLIIPKQILLIHHAGLRPMPKG